ncbi:hypothetical protein DL93DRAFT_1787664 [Clavulina sp. PMI_390]|nr:hypothetical protein DL93DRAFT_1787664 [Clavulina sp. PMI_390]
MSREDENLPKSRLELPLVFPLEIFHSIALRLDVVSIIRLSVTCKFLREYIQTSLALWREISDREARAAALAPFSVPPTLSTEELIAFATRPYRMIPALSPTLDSATPAPVEPLVDAKEFCIALQNNEFYDSHDAPHGSQYLLPGGRWMLGSQLVYSGHARLMCWDIASAVNEVPCDPAAYIDSQHRALDFPEYFSMCMQLDPESQSVTCLLGYVGRLESGLQVTFLEIISLTWPSDATPQFRFVTETAHSNDEHSPISTCKLDGDMVCSSLDNHLITLWDWKRSSYNVIELNSEYIALREPYIFSDWEGTSSIRITKCTYSENESRYLFDTTIIPSPQYPNFDNPTTFSLTPIDSDAWVRRPQGNESPLCLLGGSFANHHVIHWTPGSESWDEPLLPWLVRTGRSTRAENGLFIIPAFVRTQLAEPLAFDAVLYPWSISDGPPKSRSFRAPTSAPAASNLSQHTITIHRCIYSGTFLVYEWRAMNPATLCYRHFRYL